ncbi:Ig-like domain-containing protein, partial [bacterium]|nr:Ig-like domain-containing protein [bacterium]
MRNGIIKIWLVLLAAAALLIPAAASAQVPQTIVIDGVNDFNGANLVDADGGDTEHVPLDLGDCYVTNDAVNLYLGFEQDQDAWTDIQLGIAIDLNTVAGGITDPWGRQIEWSLSGTLPDFIMYVNLDNGWQDLRVWNTGTSVWDSAVAGTNALGWVTGTGFKELAVLLSTLGVSASDDINVEFWVTQGTTNKGPLDAAANDASQLSTPGGTTWETPSPIPMLVYLPYTIQAAADPDPPVVSGALHLVDSQVKVTFNEPVDQTTAEVAGNYNVTGATVTGAARHVTNLNVVNLTLAADIGPSVSMYTVTVSNVEDLAGNPITENGSDNVACFALKNVLFRGRMGPFLGSQTEPYGGFTVEGSPAPLTWALCDGMDGVDVGGSVYEVDADFCIPGSCGAGTAQANMEWKWVYDCVTYEPLGSNRQHLLDLATGANDVIDVWWNDQDPSQFTAHDIDVLFFVDTVLLGLAPGDSMSINGEKLPLNWNIPPELQMVDDGTGIDVNPADEIYSLLVTFPAGTEKNVNYKFVHNSTYECLTQGDRNVYLNDELFDTVGGALGPLTLPVVHFDACDVIWRGVEVV